MIILDKPYVSELLTKTVINNNYPVLKNTVSDDISMKSSLNLIDTEKSVEKIKNGEITKIYSNSENALGWVHDNMKGSDLANAVDIFKDKNRFRKAISSMYDGFTFQEVSFDNLKSLNVEEIKKPFIIKPSVGFFSIGVYKVESNDQWKDVLQEINNEVLIVSKQYPQAVIKIDNFIIEDFIEGEELAIDVYYNDIGEAVVLNILHHIFSSGADVKDRVYKTSKDIIEKYISGTMPILDKLGEMFKLKNFPMHIELRVDNSGNITPIEVNPLRFAGWCTTDMGFFAYGINNYEYFLENRKPDWNEIFKGRKDKIYSIVIGDLPEGATKANVKKIDYDAFFNNFSNVLHRRIIENTEYSAFGFAFVESDLSNIKEVDDILFADFSKYLEMK